MADSGTGAVYRQLQRPAATVLIKVSHAGNQKYYQANRESPIYLELHSLAVKTMGVVEPLRVALAPLADRMPQLTARLRLPGSQQESRASGNPDDLHPGFLLAGRHDFLGLGDLAIDVEDFGDQQVRQSVTAYRRQTAASG